MITRQQPSNPTRSTAELWLGQADLGDQRRTKRLVYCGEQLMAHHECTLPQVFRNPADLKAVYRLMDAEEVTHEAILASAQKVTLESIQQRSEQDRVSLVLSDMTELEYTTHYSLREQLGQTGNGGGRGYICHNGLAVSEEGEVIGLANQILHHRVQRKQNGKKAKRSKIKQCPNRETRLWLRGTEPLPADWNIVDVCDAGADTEEFLTHEFHSGRRFVIRSGYERNVYPGHGESTEKISVKEYAEQLPELGCKWLSIQARGGRHPRQKRKKAQLVISAGPVRIPPSNKTGKARLNALMPVYLVRVMEQDPPKGEEPLEWLLWTNHPVESLEDALRVIDWFCRRWIIEEYHKAMKTGARIEDCQFTDTSRLEPMIALLSIVGTQLLRLRDAGRRPDAKLRPATDIFHPIYVRVLSQWRWGKARPDMNIHDFYYALARLGGYQNRRHRPPGWQVLWRGWSQLHPMVRGVELAEKCGVT